MFFVTTKIIKNIILTVIISSIILYFSLGHKYFSFGYNVDLYYITVRIDNINKYIVSQVLIFVVSYIYVDMNTYVNPVIYGISIDENNRNQTEFYASVYLSNLLLVTIINKFIDFFIIYTFFVQVDFFLLNLTYLLFLYSILFLKINKKRNFKVLFSFDNLEYLFSFLKRKQKNTDMIESDNSEYDSIINGLSDTREDKSKKTEDFEYFDDFEMNEKSDNFSLE